MEKTFAEIFGPNYPTPKFSFGQRVFAATTVTTQKSYPCPDCFGSKKWTLVSPAGQHHTTTCPRCSGGSMFPSHLKVVPLKYTSHEPKIIPLTIGSISFRVYDKPVSVEYMCLETGIGSGTVYRDDTLFETAEEAEISAFILASERNSKSDQTPEHLEIQEFQYLTIQESWLDLAWHLQYDSWARARAFQELIEEFLADESGLREKYDAFVENYEWRVKYERDHGNQSYFAKILPLAEKFFVDGDTQPAEKIKELLIELRSKMPPKPETKVDVPTDDIEF